jgi:phosphoribosylanthranilate isomerase
MKGLKIKVCGLREPENIREIAALPVDMIGFIFHPGSPRAVGGGDKLPEWLENAALPGHVARVGVFVDAEIESLLNTVHDYALDYVQLHGNESAAYCAELSNIWAYTGVRKALIIKAFRVGPGFDFGTCSHFGQYCDYFLFDTQTPGFGGSGQVFDWELLRGYHGEVPFLLSGGIGPGSVDALKAFAHPCWAGIDLNSRFEKVPGVKAVALLASFIESLGKEA